MGRLIQKLNAKEVDVMQWHTKLGNITINIKVKIDFTLHGLSAKKNDVKFSCG